jgi:hypothetical protein
MARRMAFGNFTRVLLLCVGLMPCCAAAADSVLSIESNLTRAQRVFRTSLLEGPTDQVRTDSAMELLLGEDKYARYIVLSVLAQNDNIPAQAAICKALAQCRGLGVKNTNDFLDPLFTIVSTGSDQQARAAAEALTIFDFKLINDRLGKIILDSKSTQTARLNALYAIKMRPEKQAIFELIRFLSARDQQVAQTAAGHLRDILGISAAGDSTAWMQIVKDLEHKSQEELDHDRLVRLELKSREDDAKLTEWKNMYLSSLFARYDAITSDADRATFLKQMLNSDELVLQVWALDRVREWRESNKPLPSNFGPILLTLVSSNEAAVRYETARLLAYTSYFNPAEALYKQLPDEREDSIRIELLGALGAACNYARLNPDAAKVPENIIAATRGWAGEFLMQTEPRKACQGAQVLSKLLAADSMPQQEAQQFLAMFTQRYVQERTRTEPNDLVRSTLLTEMGSLCGSAAHRADAARTFEPLFLEALADKADAVREAGVSGLVKVDEPRALATLLARNEPNDGSPKVRSTIIELAGRVGTKTDLAWLSSKMSVSGAEGEAAWKAMIEIFKRSGSPLLADWVTRFDIAKVAMDRKATLLELMLQKAESENNTELSAAARKRLADFYLDSGQQVEKAARYYGMLLEGTSGKDREAIVTGLLVADLKLNQYDSAAQLFANRLLEKDLDANDVFIVKVNGYLAKNSSVQNNQLLVKALAAVKATTSRLLWQQQVKRWKDQFMPETPVTGDPNKMVSKQEIPEAVKTGTGLF